MKSRGFSLLALAVLGASLPAFGGIQYTCDPTINATQAGTCEYLNSIVSGLYGSAFTNANASIYIRMGITGLGSSTTGFFNEISYSNYVTDLTANSVASGNPIQISALAALAANDAGPYGSGEVVITSALGSALGVPNAQLTGTTAGGAACTIGTSNCYNGIITITTPANLSSETAGTQFLYWDQTGGTQPGDAYDFYSVVEHETDEVLGTSSCITTQTAPLSNPCNFLGNGTPSAVDLYRYLGAGSLLLNSSLDTTPGAYFSYDGGVTNGAHGAVYNTLDNGDDYADFASNCEFVQDATGCLGSKPMINNDGGAEINILNAVGFDVNSSSVPEPATFGLIGLGLAIAGFARSRRQN
jgi:PEP-CTERM motif